MARTKKTTTTDTATPEINEPMTGTRLAESTVLLDLKTYSLGNERKIKPAEITDKEDIDLSLLKTGKKLLVCEEYEAAAKYNCRVKEAIHARSLPSMFKAGVHLVKLDAVPVIEEQLEKAKAKQKELVEAFIAVLPQAIEDAREGLGPLFNEADYPTPERVRSAFRIEHRWFAIETPERLNGISADIFKQEQEKAQVALEDAVADLTMLLRKEFGDMVSHLASRLKPDTDGKKKTFRASTLENIKEFTELFSLRNVTDDKQLAELVEKAKALLEGTEVKAIRDDDTFRKQLAEDFTEINIEIDALPTVQVSRKITFDDDEV